MEIYVLPLVLLWIYFTGWYIISIRKNRLDWVDVAWGGGFLLVLLGTWQLNKDTAETANYIVATCVALWAIRIIYHIGKRNFSKKSDDPRYVALKRKWGSETKLKAYTRIFMTQGLMVWIISLPVIASWDVQVEGLSGIFIGLGVWIIGFLFETIADAQLAKFGKNPKNKDKILKTGLWKYSRHPNYFGEITQWWGIWLMSLYLNPVWWSVIGPLAITCLILFISGLPPQEKQFAKDKDYQAYKKRTSAIIPQFPQA